MREQYVWVIYNVVRKEKTGEERPESIISVHESNEQIYSYLRELFPNSRSVHVEGTCDWMRIQMENDIGEPFVIRAKRFEVVKTYNGLLTVS